MSHPLAIPAEDRLSFETLLANLSATFVNLRASDVDSRIKSSLQSLVEFLDADRGSLAEVLPDQGRLVVTHAYQQQELPPNRPIVLDEELPWYARTIRNGEVLRLCFLPDGLPPEAAREREYCLQVGLKSHVMIPLTVTGAVVGAIGFSSFRRRRDWPETLIQRLRLVGEIFTNALARKRADEAIQAREQALQQAREGLRELAARLLHAQEEERRRVAREMHDDWAQRLAVLSIDLARLEKHLGSPQQAMPLLRAMQGQLLSLSEDVHALSRQLHPSILDDLSLEEALRSECASVSRREKLAVAYHPEDVPAGVPRDVALCVYRVAQEALRNIAKHAGVSQARVFLTASNGELVLRVEDEGVGFDPACPRSRPGLGLSSMKERVRLVQAELTVLSTPGRGTTIAVRVPLKREMP